jgi:predicted ATP-grasp superfamily ATP-dependent carboligase
MRVLVTSSRMPFALDEIRKLARVGHEVFAADTFGTAPGNHSRYLGGAYVTASPRHDTERFIDDIARIVEDRHIDLVIPCFEEAFYLAWHAERLAARTRVFLPHFDTLATLHDKGKLRELARRNFVRTPRTTMASSQAELGRAIGTYPEYLARACFSRGGECLLTNRGPLAGVVRLADCEPTEDNPWLVQEYVEGLDVCTFSVAHRGRVTAHSAYVHPREIDHGGGIVFESIDEPESLHVARTIARATGYTGQISFDFKKTERGLVLIECNPRPTAGVFALSAEALDDALFDRRPDEVHVAPAGVRHKYSVALIRDMVINWRDAPDDLEHLFSPAKDVYADPADLMPALYQFLSYSHVLEYKLKGAGGGKRSALLGAYFDDVCWNGESMEPPRELAVG